MALKINLPEKPKRGDFFFVEPEHVIVREKLRGRHKPPSDEAIIEMAESILEHGQIQPVECRRNEESRLLLTLGFTRTAAVRLIRKGFKGTDGEHKQDAEFKLKVMVTDANDQEAFMRNVVENARRNDTSAIDDMFNQRRMRDDYGMTDAEIARHYGYRSQNKVTQLKKLLALDDPTRDLVHEGKLSVSAALDLLDAPKAERDKIVAEATKNGSGKVDGGKVRSAVREVINDEHRPDHISGNGSASANDDGPTNKPRSMRELRSFLEDTQEVTEQPAIQRFCSDMLAFLAGKTTDRAMTNGLNRLLDAKREK